MKIAMRCGAILAGLVVLGGCATYHALPLPSHANLAPAATSAAPGTATLPQVIDLHNVGLLARRRDPNLAAARAQARTAQARAYAAGLLPDPVLGFSFDKLMNGPDPYNGGTLGLATTLVGWITYGERQRAGRAEYAAAILGWQWKAAQAALKAQTTYLDAWAAGRAVAALRREAQTAQSLLAAARRANVKGALSSALYQQAQTQYASVRARLQTVAAQQIRLHNSLATALRLNVDRAWHLKEPALLQAPARARISHAIAHLSEHRLDLLALQAGYRSADAKLRAAILAQFPLLDIGFNRARDTAGNNTFGISISLRLPFFDGNRGRIAIARATRKALNAAYQAHLDSAVNNAHAAYQQLLLVRRELHSVLAQLPALAHTAHASRKALKRGDITRFQAFGAEIAWLDARIDVDRLRVQVDKLTLLLRVLLALPPSVSPPQGTAT